MARTPARAAPRPRPPPPGPTRSAPTLRILETRVMRGPNYWAREPVIRQVVDLGILEEFPTNRIPGFVDALVELLPTLEDHACSLGRRGGFITRLRDGTWAGHVAEHIALEFQNLAGTDVRHGKTRGTGDYGRYNVIFEYREEQVGIEAGPMAVGLVNHLVAPDDPDHAFDHHRGAGEPDPPRGAARVRPVHAGAPGRGRQPRHPVHPAGPVQPRPAGPGRPPAADPRHDDQPDERHRGGHRVRQEAHQPPAGLRRPARAALRGGDDRGRGRRAPPGASGYPCVVKPLDGNHGRGVALDLRDEADVRAAFPEALRQSRSRDVIVESYITGNDYRCLVIGGRLAAVAERVPASVTGDGERTIRELVEITNADPRRGIGHEKVLTRIRLDENAEERPPGPGPHARRASRPRAPS